MPLKQLNRVIVKDGFQSNNNRSCIFLKPGLQGTICSIDAEGDALIKFDGVKDCQWVRTFNFPYLEKIQKAVQQLSLKSRLTFEGNVSRNRAWEQKLRGVYGLEGRVSGSTLPECSTSSRGSRATRVLPDAWCSPSGSRCNSRLSSSPVRCQSADGSVPLMEFHSLRDDAAYMALLQQEVYAREDGKEFDFAAALCTGAAGGRLDSTDSIQDKHFNSQSITQPSTMEIQRWNMPVLQPTARAQVPCKRARHNCWLPSSRDHGGRYSNSPGPHLDACTKEDFAALSYISLQSIDGRAMRVHTPEPGQRDRNDRPRRWKPWVHCTVRPP